MASRFPSFATVLYYLYSFELQTVDSFDPAFVWTFFQQIFCPKSEHESLLTYQGRNKGLEMRRSNLSQWFKGPPSISSTQQCLLLYLGTSNRSSVIILRFSIELFLKTKKLKCPQEGFFSSWPFNLLIFLMKVFKLFWENNSWKSKLLHIWVKTKTAKQIVVSLNFCVKNSLPTWLVRLVFEFS